MTRPPVVQVSTRIRAFGLCLGAALVVTSGLLAGCSSSGSSGSGNALQLKTVSGTVRETGGAPLPNVTVTALGGTSVTDGSGNFLLVNMLPNGDVHFEFDGTTVNQAGKQFPVLGVVINLTPGESNVLPQVITLPNLMNPNSSTQTVSVDASGATTAPISTAGVQSDLQISGPPGTIITINGQPATAPVDLNVTPVPPQEVPMPLPDIGIVASSFITVQPGGASFNPALSVIMPNDLNYPVGTEVEIWSFDHDEGQWVNRSAETGNMGIVVDLGGGMTQIEATEVITEGGWHSPVVTVDPDCVTTVVGHVVNGGSGEGIPGASIALSTGQFGQTDAMGFFTIQTVPAYDLSGSAMGACSPTSFEYEIVAPPNFGTVSNRGTRAAGSVAVGGTTDLGTIALTIPSTGTLAGLVIGTGASADEPVFIDGDSLATEIAVVPNPDGSFFVSNLEAGDYTASYLFQGQVTPIEEMVTIIANQITTVNIQFADGGGTDLVNVLVIIREQGNGPLVPVPGAFVRLQGADATSAAGLIGMTDASGLTTFENVTGPFNVTAQIDRLEQDGNQIDTVRHAASVINITPVGGTIGVLIESFDDDFNTNPVADATFNGTLSNFPNLNGGSLEVFVQSAGSNSDEFFNQTQADPFSGSYNIDVQSGRMLNTWAVQYDDQNRIQNVVLTQNVGPVGPGTNSTVDFNFAGPSAIPFDRPVDVTFTNAAPNPIFQDVFICLLGADGSELEFELADPESGFFGGDVTVSAPDFMHPSLTGFRIFLASEQNFLVPESPHGVGAECLHAFTTTPASINFEYPTIPTPVIPADRDSFPLDSLSQLGVSFMENESSRGGNGLNRVFFDNVDDSVTGIDGIDVVEWSIWLSAGTFEFTIPPTALPMFAEGIDYFCVLEKLRVVGFNVDYNSFFNGNVIENVNSVESDSVIDCDAEIEVTFSAESLPQ